MTRRGWEARWTSVLSLLAVMLCAGCLNAGSEVRSVEASAGDSSDSSAETSTRSTSRAGEMPEATIIGASRIEGDLAGAADASSGVPFVAKTQASGGFRRQGGTRVGAAGPVHED